MSEQLTSDRLDAFKHDLITITENFLFNLGSVGRQLRDQILDGAGDAIEQWLEPCVSDADNPE